MGRNYLLSNWEATRNFRSLPIAEIKVGPFVDNGKVSDPISQPSGHTRLCDLGVEAKLKASGFGLVLWYGRDLRAGP